MKRKEDCYPYKVKDILNQRWSLVRVKNSIEPNEGTRRCDQVTIAKQHLNKGVDQVQWCCNEHEHVFTGSSNTCQEGASAGKAIPCIFLFIRVHIAIDNNYNPHRTYQ